MAASYFVVALLAVLCHSAFSGNILRFDEINEACQYSPSVWCSSEEIARSCAVLPQCQAALRSVQGKAPAVNVTLYMESLCPDCKAFFKNQFYPVWQALKSSGIMNVDVVPYGNAEEEIRTHRWLFTCQHGPDECEGNQIETCAIGYLRYPSVWMPYIDCLEREMSKGNIVPAASKCATTHNVSYPHIHTCSHNEWGDRLEHHMAVRTRQLNPQHKYVPWVTVNGVHNEQIQQQAESNLLQLVCSTYRGTKPKACSQSKSRCQK